MDDVFEVNMDSSNYSQEEIKIAIFFNMVKHLDDILERSEDKGVPEEGFNSNIAGLNIDGNDYQLNLTLTKIENE